MDAPCSVMLVKQKLPFSELHARAAEFEEETEAAPADPPKIRSSLYSGPLE